MSYHRLVINNNPYVLRDSGVRQTIAAAVVAAVRAGGDFVHIPDDRHDIDVLVTPASDARIEYVERDTTTQPVEMDDLGWVDFGHV